MKTKIISIVRVYISADIEQQPHNNAVVTPFQLTVSIVEPQKCFYSCLRFVIF